MNTDATKTARRRVLSGVVVSDKMDKTAVVAITRYVKHPKYQKFVKQVKRYKAHDAENECREGDAVRIEECLPLSKDKRFAVIERDAKADEEASEAAPITE